MKATLLFLATLTCLPLTGCLAPGVVVRPRPYAPVRTVVVEDYGRRPHPRAVWVNGHWAWQNRHRVWVPGRWAR